MKKKVVCVNYLNTKPLIRSLDKDPYQSLFEVIPENPRVCSEKFIDGTADIALVPVATLVEEIKDYHIISDYCIASEGAVNTVGIFSNCELKQINKIFLDDHSKTSQQLTKVIFENYLNINPKYDIVNVEDIKLGDNEGVLMIGDKAFGAKDQFTYFYDLGELWTNFTGLPFVYAVWIAKVRDQETEEIFNKGIEEGLKQIPAIIAENKSLHPEIDLQAYYTDYIEYKLDDDKRAGLKLFLETLQIKNIPSLP